MKIVDFIFRNFDGPLNHQGIVLFACNGFLNPFQPEFLFEIVGLEGAASNLFQGTEIRKAFSVCWNLVSNPVQTGFHFLRVDPGCGKKVGVFKDQLKRRVAGSVASECFEVESGGGLKVESGLWIERGRRTGLGTVGGIAQVGARCQVFCFDPGLFVKDSSAGCDPDQCFVRRLLFFAQTELGISSVGPRFVSVFEHLAVFIVKIDGVVRQGRSFDGA